MSEQQMIASARFDPVMPRSVAWFCIRSQQKHEQVAAGHLSQIEDVEVLNPRVRYSRSTPHGPAIITESLFPNYLFARFDWQKSLARVNYAPGVRHIVHFGNKWPTVPDEAIEELRSSLGNELHVIEPGIAPGDCVELSGGAFHGLKAVVAKVMPAQQRIAVLMDFLGRQTMVEVWTSAVVRG